MVCFGALSAEWLQLLKVVWRLDHGLQEMRPARWVDIDKAGGDSLDRVSMAGREWIAKGRTEESQGLGVFWWADVKKWILSGRAFKKMKVGWVL